MRTQPQNHPATIITSESVAHNPHLTYIPSLDGLRAIAITLVLLFHFEYLPFGWIGVQLFFVLSGFLITTILLKERSAPLRSYLGRFYWRRSLRLFPVYVLYLVGIVVMWLSIGVPAGLARWLPSLWTYTFNLARINQHLIQPLVLERSIGHLWSLAVEEQFYVLWPLLIYYVGSRLGQVTLALMFIVMALRFVFALVDTAPVGFPNEVLYFHTLFQLDAFALGALLACTDWRKYRSMQWFAYGWIGMCIVLGLIQMLWLQRGLAGMYPVHLMAGKQYLWGYTAVNLACLGIVLLTLLELRGWQWLAHPWLVGVGKISYGVYMYHYILNYLFLNILFPTVSTRTYTLAGIAVFVLYFASVIGVAAVSFRVVELPLLHLKDRFFRRTLNRDQQIQRHSNKD